MPEMVGKKLILGLSLRIVHVSWIPLELGPLHLRMFWLFCCCGYLGIMYFVLAGLFQVDTTNY